MTGGASIATDTASQALHLSLATSVCGTVEASRTVTIPAGAGSIRFSLSGDIAADGDNQIWFTLCEDAVNVYGLAIPATPLSTAREENWCIPTGGQGQTVTLSFVIRAQSTCNPMDAWIDDIVFSPDAAGCMDMPPPT